MGSGCFTWNQTLVEEAKMPVWTTLDQRNEKRVQMSVPVQERLTWIAKKFQQIGSRRLGCKMSRPKIRLPGACPPTRQRRDPGGASKPGPWFPFGGGALIGQEQNQSSLAQGPVSLFVPSLVVVDRRLMEVAHMGEQALPKRVVRRSGDADGIRTEGVENSRQPLPIPVMHGEKNRGVAAPRPGFTQGLEWAKIQLVPATSQKEGGLVAGVLKELTGKPGGNGRVDGARQAENIGSAGYGKNASQKAQSDPGRRLPRSGQKGDFDLASIDGLDWVRQGPQIRSRDRGTNATARSWRPGGETFSV